MRSEEYRALLHREVDSWGTIQHQAAKDRAYRIADRFSHMLALKGGRVNVKLSNHTAQFEVDWDKVGKMRSSLRHPGYQCNEFNARRGEFNFAQEIEDGICEEVPDSEFAHPAHFPECGVSCRWTYGSKRYKRRL